MSDVHQKVQELHTWLKSQHERIFSQSEIAAIASGQKTEIRDIMDPQPGHRWNHMHGLTFCSGDHERADSCDGDEVMDSPIQVGHKIWVKEPWAAERKTSDSYPDDIIAINFSHFSVWKRSSCFEGNRERFNLDFLGRWRPAETMPLAACDLKLEVIEVTAQLLRDMSEQDAYNEGFSTISCARCSESGKEPSGEYAGEPCEDCNGEGWIKSLPNFLRSFKSDIKNPWLRVIKFEVKK